MKKSLKIILGLALIAAGILWMLNILGVLHFTFSTQGWWALFIIVPCLFGLVSDRDKFGPLIGLCIGVLLFLAARGTITWQMMWQLFLACLAVGFGLKILFFKGIFHNHEVSTVETVNREGRTIRRIESSFGKQDLSFAGEKFEGADVEASFGGVSLNLRGAEIDDQAFINLNVGFSGVTIIVPEGQAVRVSVNSGFGGVADKRRTKVSSGTPLLIITGKVGFGGVEIRD